MIHAHAEAVKNIKNVVVKICNDLQEKVLLRPEMGNGIFFLSERTGVEMDVYSGFAEVYDLFMDNVPYDQWCDYLLRLLKRYGVLEGIVADLGCGTGNVTERMAKVGYDMIGIDRSEEMLQIAMEKKAESGLDILYLMQDMRELELYGTVRAIVSICDSMNYITEYEDLKKIFRLANTYLDPGGVFIFDMNTLHKYRDILGDRTFAENREEGSFIWENEFDPEKCMNMYDLTLYIEQNGVYKRLEEEHYQRAYSIEDVKKAGEEAGLLFEACFEAFTMQKPSENSERIYFVFKECRKTIKGEQTIK